MLRQRTIRTRRKQVGSDADALATPVAPSAGEPTAAGRTVSESLAQHTFNTRRAPDSGGGLVTVVSLDGVVQVPSGHTVSKTLALAGQQPEPYQSVRVGVQAVPDLDARTCLDGEMVTITNQAFPYSG